MDQFIPVVGTVALLTAAAMVAALLYTLGLMQNGST